MVTWNNLDTLASYQKLTTMKNRVNIVEAMSGENGAERVKRYSAPMAEGLTYNYAAKEIDDTILEQLAALAEEAQLVEKFEALYNGERVNTGENRMVLHHLARRQLGNDVVENGVNKRDFYAGVQAKAAEFANKVHAGEITNAAGESFTTFLSASCTVLALEVYVTKSGSFVLVVSCSFLGLTT